MAMRKRDGQRSKLLYISIAHRIQLESIKWIFIPYLLCRASVSVDIQTCNKSKFAFVNRVSEGFYLHYSMQISIQIRNNNRVIGMFINICAYDVKYMHVAVV